MQVVQFAKGQRVVAIDGRYEARVLRRHRDGTITIRQGFCLQDGVEVPGTFLGYVHRISPHLVRAPADEETDDCRYVAMEPVTIGDMELLAGIEDRAEFWKPLIPLLTQDNKKGMEAWRIQVDAAIRHRVEAGQVSLLYRTGR